MKRFGPVSLLLILTLAPSCTQDASSQHAWDLGEPQQDRDDGYTGSLDVGVADMDPGDLKQEADDMEKNDMLLDDMSAPPPEEMKPALTRACISVEQDNCPIVEAMSFGDCAQPLGYVFDGTQCIVANGCACEDGDEGCPAFFESATACATACEEASYCQGDVLKLAAAQALECKDISCSNNLVMCIASSENPNKRIEGLLPQFGDVHCSQEESLRAFCIIATDKDCPVGHWCCEALASGGVIENDNQQGLCAVSLLEGASSMGCYELD